MKAKGFLSFVVLMALWLSFDAHSTTTKIILTPTDDSFVRGEKYAETNYGVSSSSTEYTYLRIRGTPADSNQRAAYLKFDLSSVNVNTVGSALLKLTVYRAVNDKQKIDRADFYSVLDDNWFEGYITWNTAPPGDQLLFGKRFKRKTSSNRDTTYYFDITNYVNNELAGDKFLTIKAFDDSLNNTDLRFYSKEAAMDTSRPMLIIDTASTGVGQEGSEMAKVFSVRQNYPNPFNPETTIRLDIAATSSVTAEVYDLLGHRIKILTSGILSAGSHRITWRGDTETGEPAPAGVYFARIHAGGQVKMIKMLLVK